MESQAYYPRPAGVLTGTDLGDELLFYNRDRDCVHVLNGTAREIFLLCDGTRTEGEVASAIVEKYGIDVATAREDTRATLLELYELGLLEKGGGKKGTG